MSNPTKLGPSSTLRDTLQAARGSGVRKEGVPSNLRPLAIPVSNLRPVRPSGPVAAPALLPALPTQQPSLSRPSRPFTPRVGAPPVHMDDTFTRPTTQSIRSSSLPSNPPSQFLQKSNTMNTNTHVNNNPTYSFKQLIHALSYIAPNHPVPIPPVPSPVKQTSIHTITKSFPTPPLLDKLDEIQQQYITNYNEYMKQTQTRVQMVSTIAGLFFTQCLHHYNTNNTNTNAVNDSNMKSNTFGVPLPHLIWAFQVVCTCILPPTTHLCNITQDNHIMLKKPHDWVSNSLEQYMNNVINASIPLEEGSSDIQYTGTQFHVLCSMVNVMLHAIPQMEDIKPIAPFMIRLVKLAMLGYTNSTQLLLLPSLACMNALLNKDNTLIPLFLSQQLLSSMHALQLIETVTPRSISLLIQNQSLFKLCLEQEDGLPDVYIDKLVTSILTLQPTYDTEAIEVRFKLLQARHVMYNLTGVSGFTPVDSIQTTPTPIHNHVLRVLSVLSEFVYGRTVLLQNKVFLQLYPYLSGTCTLAPRCLYILANLTVLETAPKEQLSFQVVNTSPILFYIHAMQHFMNMYTLDKAPQAIYSQTQLIRIFANLCLDEAVADALLNISLFPQFANILLKTIVQEIDRQREPNQSFTEFMTTYNQSEQLLNILCYLANASYFTENHVFLRTDNTLAQQKVATQRIKEKSVTTPQLQRYIPVTNLANLLLPFFSWIKEDFSAYSGEILQEILRLLGNVSKSPEFPIHLFYTHFDEFLEIEKADLALSCVGVYVNISLHPGREELPEHVMSTCLSLLLQALHTQYESNTVISQSTKDANMEQEIVHMNTKWTCNEEQAQAVTYTQESTEELVDNILNLSDSVLDIHPEIEGLYAQLDEIAYLQLEIRKLSIPEEEVYKHSITSTSKQDDQEELLPSMFEQVDKQYGSDSDKDHQNTSHNNASTISRVDTSSTTITTTSNDDNNTNPHRKNTLLRPTTTSSSTTTSHSLLRPTTAIRSEAGNTYFVEEPDSD